MVQASSRKGSKSAVPDRRDSVLVVFESRPSSGINKCRECGTIGKHARDLDTERAAGVAEALGTRVVEHNCERFVLGGCGNDVKVPPARHELQTVLGDRSVLLPIERRVVDAGLHLRPVEIACKRHDFRGRGAIDQLERNKRLSSSTS